MAEVFFSCEENSPDRVDKILARAFPHKSRALIQRAIESNMVKRKDGTKRGFASNFKHVFGLNISKSWDNWIEFEKDEGSEKITAYLHTGSFEIIDRINEMKICENDPYIMIVKDSWSGENKDGEEVGYVSFEALYAEEEPPVLKGGEYDKKSFMTKSELDEFNELCENESVYMDDCKYQDFYFLKESEYNPKEWIEKWLSEDYGHNK